MQGPVVRRAVRVRRERRADHDGRGGMSLPDDALSGRTPDRALNARLREPTECGLCPWEQVFADDDAAERGLAKHRQVRHGEAATMDSATWRDRAIEAIRILAARGPDFALYEIHTMDVGEPIDPS